MITDCATNAHSMKSFQMELVSVEITTLETMPLEAVFLPVQLVNSNIKEDVLNVHWIFNTDLKSKVVLVQMDSILIIMEFVKKLFLLQLLVMQDFSSIVQRDVLLAQLAAKTVLVPQFVLYVLKMVFQLSMVSVKLNVVMESLLEPNNVMIKINYLMMDVLQHAKLKLFGLALVNHQLVLTMVQLFVEMED